MIKIFSFSAFFLFLNFSLGAQTGMPKRNDSNTPLHELQPGYPVPYLSPSVASVKDIADRVLNYLEASTPIELINRSTGATVTNLSDADSTTTFKDGDFRLISYEWGVTYAAMLQMGKATGDEKYTNYTSKRLHFIASVQPTFLRLFQQQPEAFNPLRSVVDPHALDDAGAMCAAMIKTLQAGRDNTLRPLIDNYIRFISKKQYRFPDGTLARNRPHPNTLWLDDLFMSVPALSQMGKLTNDKKYFDDAVKQVIQFSSRMFNTQKNIYMHGWVQGMRVHPEFHWARANGWAMLATVELLDVLPHNHPGYTAILQLLQKHIKGIVSYQSGTGLWHQLLDRNDSYLETSASAIYTYCLAHAINKGWIDPLAYGPAALLGWNAITTKINEKGQVEGTCVGTGMGFDPAFYYYRPVNVFAAHGYGPVLMAAAEMITLLKKNNFKINDSAIQYYKN